MRVLHRGAWVGMTKAIQARCHRHSFSVHHRFVPVAERMETALLNPELCEQRVEFTFPNHVRVPGRPVPRGKKKPEPVRSPGAQESTKMLRELRRDFADAITLFRLYRLDLSPSTRLPTITTFKPSRLTFP